MSPHPFLYTAVLLCAPFSCPLLNATALFSWKWRSVSLDGYWKSQLRRKTSFHGNFIVLLYCFVKRGLLLSSWVIEKSLSKNNIPLPASDSHRNSRLVGDEELASAKSPPDLNCRDDNTKHILDLYNAAKISMETMNHLSQFCKEMILSSCSFAGISEKQKRRVLLRLLSEGQMLADRRVSGPLV